MKKLIGMRSQRAVFLREIKRFYDQGWKIKISTVSIKMEGDEVFELSAIFIKDEEKRAKWEKGRLEKEKIEEEKLKMECLKIECVDKEIKGGRLDNNY